MRCVLREDNAASSFCISRQVGYHCSRPAGPAVSTVVHTGLSREVLLQGVPLQAGCAEGGHDDHGWGAAPGPPQVQAPPSDVDELAWWRVPAGVPRLIEE